MELGLQTIHDATAEQFRRGYGFDQFLRSFQALRERHIRICVHLINGLPSEMDADMLETARVVGRLRPDAVKIHLLHILRGTPLAAQWRAGRIPVLSQGEYVQITAAQLAESAQDRRPQRHRQTSKVHGYLAGEKLYTITSKKSLNGRPPFRDFDAL